MAVEVKQPNQPAIAGKRKAKEMKTYINRYKKCIVAVLLAGGAGLFLAANGDPQPAPKLEGAWVAHVEENGVLALVTFAPDPSGRAATFRNQMVLPPAFVAYMNTQVPGFSGFTDEIGEQVMTGKNSSAYTARWYGLVNGSPALVYLDNATLEFTSPTQISIVHQITGYAADANGQPVGDPVIPTGTYHSTSRRIIQ